MSLGLMVLRTAFADAIILVRLEVARFGNGFDNLRVPISEAAGSAIPSLAIRPGSSRPRMILCLALSAALVGACGASPEPSSVSVVSVGLTGGGCDPQDLAIPAGRVTLRVTNHAGGGEFDIQRPDRTSVARIASIDLNETKDLLIDLETGYYLVECRTDGSIAQLTVGAPTGAPPALGAAPIPQRSPSSGTAATDGNAYLVTNLVANSPAYSPRIVDPSLVDAWGLANRPAGAGGHIWVTSNGGGNSIEYVGDVGDVPLYQNDLRSVSIPGVIDNDPGALPGTRRMGTPTGVVFNANPGHFVITQGDITAGAKFIFAGTDGIISAWTERAATDSVPGESPSYATVVADRSAEGSQFFGLAIAPGGDRLLVADFGSDPRVRVYDNSFHEETTTAFANPFNPHSPIAPGDLAPWNVTTIGDRVLVSYATVGATESDPKVASVGEEGHSPGAGRVVEFDASGAMVKIWADDGALDAPWGISVAPAGWGKLAGDLLVANFGDGSVAAFTPDGKFLDYVRGSDNKPLLIDGIWALLPGNGASLGRADAVYFTAGPHAERDGVFGRIDAAK